MDRVSSSDEDIEANLSTVFQSVRGSTGILDIVGFCEWSASIALQPFSLL